MAVRSSGYELSEMAKKTQPIGLRRKERSIRYLPGRYRGLHNVKTRDKAKYEDFPPVRLYGFAE
ncbi:hypothetical protein MspRI1_04090 [Marinobacter sp. RI1]|jgi:hypothetical protein